MASSAPFTPETLVAQNDHYGNSPACSAGNRRLGFLPAFMDTATGAVYPSRFADGRPAPVHLLDGLPQHVVVARAADGRVRAAKPTILPGFVRDWRFYTREEALRRVELEQDDLRFAA